MRNLGYAPEEQLVHKSEREIYPPLRSPASKTSTAGSCKYKIHFLEHFNMFERTYRVHRPHLNLSGTTAS